MPTVNSPSTSQTITVELDDGGHFGRTTTHLVRTRKAQDHPHVSVS